MASAPHTVEMCAQRGLNVTASTACSSTFPYQFRSHRAQLEFTLEIILIVVILLTWAHDVGKKTSAKYSGDDHPK